MTMRLITVTSTMFTDLSVDSLTFKLVNANINQQTQLKDVKSIEKDQIIN